MPTIRVRAGGQREVVAAISIAPHEAAATLPSVGMPMRLVIDRNHEALGLQERMNSPLEKRKVRLRGLRPEGGSRGGIISGIRLVQWFAR